MHMHSSARVLGLVQTEAYDELWYAYRYTLHDAHRGVGGNGVKFRVDE